jgi:hypothetical protein
MKGPAVEKVWILLVVADAVTFDASPVNAGAIKVEIAG